MFRKSPTDYADKIDYDGFNSHESHEFSRIFTNFILYKILYVISILSHELAAVAAGFTEIV